MSEDSQIDRWRKDLSGRDPVKMLNTFAAVGNSGLEAGIELLELAGAHVPQDFWDQPIQLPHKTLTVREFRDECLAKLRASLPHAATPAESSPEALFAFVSYSTADRVRATQLAAGLAQSEGREVFLDHWQLAAGDLLRDRLAASIGKAGALVLLVSKASLASHWVEAEIALAVKRAEADPRFRIVPVLLDDVPLPEYLGDIVYVDWRNAASLPAVAQAVLDRLRGLPPFSARVDALIRGKRLLRNPYQDRHQRAGQTLLPLVASSGAIAVEANQLWLLWELFRHVVDNYRCTLRIGNVEGSTTTRFELRDRWLETLNTIELDEPSLAKGLWTVTIDPSQSKRWCMDELRSLGDTGRISFRSSCHPRTDENPIHPADEPAVRALLDDVVAAMEPCEQASRESFLFDLQSVVAGRRWHQIEIVIGGVHTNVSLASSPMLHAEPGLGSAPGATMEIWDPFFAAMKSTELYRSQLVHLWEADVNLRSNQWETLLGLA
jgi:hypothetical protein